MTFLSTLRALDARAINAPWKPHQADSGEFGLVYRRPNGMVRPVADFPGSGDAGSDASDASIDLTAFLRNRASRIAAVVEAAEMMPVGPALEDEPGPYVYVPIDDLRALRDALYALDKEEA